MAWTYSAIERVEHTRSCRCNQNVNRLRCGHDEVTEVLWYFQGQRYYTRAAARAAVDEANDRNETEEV